MGVDRLKILYHHRTQGKGVEGVHIRQMVNAWQKQGHQVDVVGAPIVSVLDEDNNTGNKSIFPSIYRFFSKYMPELIFEVFEIYYNFYVCRRLRKAFRKNRYTFLYERYALFNWSGVREARKARVPLMLEVNYTSHTKIYRKRSKIFNPLASWIESWVFENAHGIVVVSTYLKEHLIQLGIDKTKIIILTNAANPNNFSPRVTGEKIKRKYNLKRKTVIGFAGGFYPWHGLDLLLTAFKIISRTYYEVSLLLIGDGPMRLSIEKEALGSGLKERVISTGNILHSELPAYVSAFDIAVMPHSNEYGSPMKVYEYMAMGKPVVVPKFGPLEDCITQGVEGFLFEPGNINEFISYLERLIKDTYLREVMGSHGRRRIVTRHNWKNNALSVVKFFNFLNTSISEANTRKTTKRQSVYL